MAQNFYSESIQSSGITELTPSLEWKAIGFTQKTPTLEWVASKLNQLSPTLQWKTKERINFCPNLINFTYDWLEPVIISKQFTASTYGCLYSYSINFDNTGTSGTTEIEIYISSVLKKSISITASDDAYTLTEYFDLTDVIDVLDTVEVKVTGVAQDTEGLKVNVFQMSFPFVMNRITMGNLHSGNIINGYEQNTLVYSADYWVIEMNQPVKSVVSLVGISDRGVTENLTYTIEDGLFKDSRIQITPSNTEILTNIALVVKDMNNTPHSFTYDIEHLLTYANLFDYNSEDSREIYVNSPIDYYQYSFDDVTYSTLTSPVDGKMTVDFSGQGEGNITLYLKYKSGTRDFSENKVIYNTSAVLDCEVVYFPEGVRLLYSDTVPFKQVELYDGNTLIESSTLPLFSGFDNVTVDATLKTLSMNSGKVYYQNNIYEYTPVVHNITSTYNGTQNYYAMFYFDLLDFTFKWEEGTYIVGLDTPQPRQNIIKLYETSFYTPALASDDFIFLDSGVYYPNELIPVNLETIADLTITVQDLALRTKDFTRQNPITIYDNWKTLTVKDTSDNIILPGQIHFETDLVYTYEPEVER